MFKAISRAVDDYRLRRWQARVREIEALADSGASGAVERLLAALSDPEAAVRREAAHGLGRIGSAWAVELLIVALTDEWPSVRSAAARALGRLGDRRAVEPLLAVAGNVAYPEAAADAVEALAALNDTRAAGPLLALLAEANGRTGRDWPSDTDELAAATVRALGTLGGADAIGPIAAYARQHRERRRVAGYAWEDPLAGCAASIAVDALERLLRRASCDASDAELRDVRHLDGLRSACWQEVEDDPEVSYVEAWKEIDCSSLHALADAELKRREASTGKTTGA